jgi:polyhydroxyalkanoate synthesis regulator protein
LLHNIILESSKVLQNLTVAQLLKEVQSFYGNQQFII